MALGRTRRQRRGLEPTREAARLRAGWERLEGQLADSYAAYLQTRIARVTTRPLLLVFFGLLLIAKIGHLAEIVAATEAWEVAAGAVAAYHALTLAFLALALVLFMARRPARRPVRRLLGGIVALAGTFLPSWLIIDPARTVATPLAAPAGLCLIGGMIITLWSLTTLGRNLSILPEARGLVREGPYRFVRHPLYLGEMVAMLGVLLPVITTRNVAIFAAFCALQLWRTRYEEEVLAATFAEYDEYRRRTARLLPGLF